MSAIDNLGPHLLGRVPSPFDPRDFKLEDYLEASTPLDSALAALVSSKGVAKATKTWATFITNYLKGQPTPTPTPTPAPTPPPPTPPPSTDQTWEDLIQLDQGNTGHCVGFGWAAWGNSAPVEDTFQNADGDKIYYECKVIDGEPGQEDGSYVRSGAKAMKNRGKLTAYAFTTSVETIKTWIKTKGPVVAGTDWMNDMFYPDANGYITPTGGVAGGHCYLLIGYLESEDAFEIENSWGNSWGQKGRAKIKTADFAQLLAAQGEACTSVEVATASIEI